jgi:spermidine/putrescine-binding protein
MANLLLRGLVVALVAGATALALPMQGQAQVKARVPVVLWHGAAPPQNPRAVQNTCSVLSAYRVVARYSIE